MQRRRRQQQQQPLTKVIVTLVKSLKSILEAFFFSKTRIITFLFRGKLLYNNLIYSVSRMHKAQLENDELDLTSCSQYFGLISSHYTFYRSFDIFSRKLRSPLKKVTQLVFQIEQNGSSSLNLPGELNSRFYRGLFWCEATSGTDILLERAKGREFI